MKNYVPIWAPPKRKKKKRSAGKLQIFLLLLRFFSVKLIDDIISKCFRRVEVPCLLNMGAVYIAEKNFDDALKEMTKILEIQEDDESERDLTGKIYW